MATLSEIRQQVLDLLKETSSDSHFTPTQLNSYINQGLKLISPIIELPRKKSSGTQVTAGMGDITLPTDNILILDAYYGNVSTGKIVPLVVTTEQIIKQFYPSWLSTLAGDRGTPRFFFQSNETTGVLIPRADTDASETDKKVYFNYVYETADLSSDSDSPKLPLPYHQIVKFYVLYLCYLSLSNPDLASKYKSDFIDHHKSILAGATKETREGFAFAWGLDEVNTDNEGSISFT